MRRVPFIPKWSSRSVFLLRFFTEVSQLIWIIEVSHRCGTLNLSPYPVTRTLASHWCRLMEELARIFE